ncbi:MAG TPA: VWA domain-containing protein [Gammaproteobacteria bacterium]|nr:VWA domain-containing protein [Gammaproteobacteria bacterium]
MADWRIIWLVLVFLCLLTSAHAAKKNDVRVLIDISGSMKQNDPHKLRAPALRLLVGLLPQGSESGVWTFGQYVNMQVKLGRVDMRWKKLARAESKKIHSRGLYTNIEEVLRQASVGWTKIDKKTRRSLILLTDGMVDISPDAKKNAASRQRILKNILPQLKEAGVRLHTIALSAGADKALLKQLSAATGGSYIQVDDARSLERAFLKLFEKAAPADSLAIKGNRFKLDTSVRDMTVLVFRKETRPVQLVNPQGKAFDYQKHPQNFSWSQENSYELITVKKPIAGEWIIKGSKDPDNRVMIVTNLKLDTDELPPSILAGDKVLVEAELLNKGERITRKSFLNLVNFQVEVNGNVSYSMLDTGKGPDSRKDDGHYSVDLTGKLGGGEQLLIIRAKGATFEREFRYTLDNFLSVVDVKLTEDESSKRFYLSIIPHAEIVDVEDLHINVKLEDEHSLPVNQEPGGLWVSEIDKKNEGKFVTIVVDAKRHTGEKVQVKIKKKLVIEKIKKKSGRASSVAEEGNDRSTKENSAHEDGNGQIEGDKTEVQGGINWFLVGWITLVVNIFLAIIGILVFRFWKKKKASQDDADDKDVAL